MKPKVSRQVKYQRARVAEGRCQRCGKRRGRAGSGTRCGACRENDRINAVRWRYDRKSLDKLDKTA